MTFDEYMLLDEETRMRVAASQALAANMSREIILDTGSMRFTTALSRAGVAVDEVSAGPPAGGEVTPAKAGKKLLAGQVLSSKKSGKATAAKAPRRRSGS